MHFEELWEKCEELNKEGTATIPNLLDTLSMKLELYKVLDTQNKMPLEECQKAKSRIMGEILMTLTHLSLLDNIDVAISLATAFQYRSIDLYSKKY